QHSDADDLAHIRHLARAFADPRYVRVDGKPLFLVYRASRLPSPRRTVDAWRHEADRLGIGELFLARVESFAHEEEDPRSSGFDAAVEFQPQWRRLRGWMGRAVMDRLARATGIKALEREYTTHEYAAVMEAALRRAAPYPRFPCVVPSWDNS